MCKVIAVSNQKGGVGKTVSCVNLGIGLAKEGKKVLLIDGDPQGSLTISLGYEEPDKMEYSLATLMMNIVNDEKLNMEKTILHHKEGVDMIPANIELSAIEVSLVNAMSRELILRSLTEKLREFYDFIIIDCMPSLGMMTINALACADSVLIPVQAAYLPVKGLQQLIKTIGRVKKQLNPKLKIEGILLTMVDNRTNYARDISLMVYDTYSASIKVFGTEIPMSVRDSFVEKLSTMRSRNMSAVIIVQNLIQLKRKFSKFDMDKDLIGNCSIIDILGAPDMDSCEYLSKYFGTQIIHKASESDAKDYKGQSSRSEDVMKKSLLSAEDIFAMKNDGECAIVVKGADPLYQTKCRMERTDFVKLLYRKHNLYDPKKRQEIRKEKLADISPVFFSGERAKTEAKKLLAQGEEIIHITVDEAIVKSQYIVNAAGW